MKNNIKKISIVIPVLNEEKNIGSLIFVVWTTTVLFALTYYSIKFSLNIWYLEPSIISISKYGGSSSIIVIINNFLYTILGQYSNKVASIFLFILGFGSFIISIINFITMFGALGLSKKNKKK